MKLTRITLIVVLLSLWTSTIGQSTNPKQIFDLIRISDSLLYDQPQEGLDLAIKANELAELLKNDSLISITLNRVGAAHRSLGNEMQALEKIHNELLNIFLL